MKKTLISHSKKETNSLKLSLIGMSGAGKSYWAKKMEEKGYRWYNCDEMIAERLGPKLLGKGKTTLKLAKWMGQPFSEGYIEAEKLYLELEETVVENICNELEQSIEINNPIVVDTTGSLIYLQKKILTRLSALTQMAYLKLPEEKHEQLFEDFINAPKPVIWKGKFETQKGEDQQYALRRCYKNLISFRNEKYNVLADYVIDYSFHHSPEREVDDLLYLIKTKIKKT